MTIVHISNFIKGMTVIVHNDLNSVGISQYIVGIL